MNHFIASSAAEKCFSILREFQPIKGLVYIHMRDHLSGDDVHHKNLMAAVAAVQHRGITAGRMDRDIDRKIA